ncbi:MAG: endonuclease/exonuclease/phosphatase family protein [Pseudomonadota bacterium]
MKTGAERPSRIQRLAGHARGWLLPCGLGLALPLLNRLLPPSANTFAWLIDLAAHWQLLYAPLWLALCLLCALRARRWLLLAPFALLPLWSASARLPDSASGAPALVIVAANVHVGNRDPAPLVAWLRAQPADMVAMSELTPEYAQALSHALGDDYRYRELRPRQSPFGIGIVSRLPLRNAALIDDADGVQTLLADVDIAGRTARIVAAHPMPPLAPEWQGKRDAMLTSIAKQSGRQPLIVVGDLNATPWSTALIDAGRLGLLRTTGFAPSWPGSGRGAIGIPIDHVLASGHWRRGASSRGPDIGSDHLPIRVALHWADDRQ